MIVKVGTTINSLELHTKPLMEMQGDDVVFNDPPGGIAFISEHGNGEERIWVESDDGRYVVNEYLEDGNQSEEIKNTVYLGYDNKLQCPIAIKISSTPTHMRNVQALWPEAVLTAKIEHPNVAKIIDFTIVTDGALKYPVLVEEYIPGENLREVCKKEDLKLEHVFQIFNKVALGMDYIHSQGFVHRDIKLGNIVAFINPVTHELDAKIVDCATLLPKDRRSLSIWGTIPFLSPYAVSEARQRQEDDRWAGIVSIFALITGEYPFSITEKDEFSLIGDFNHRSSIIKNSFLRNRYGLFKCLKLEKFFDKAFGDYEKYMSFKEIMDDFNKMVVQ